MKNTIYKTTLCAFVAAALAAVPSVSRAAETNAPAVKAPAKNGAAPFHGKVTAVDAAAKTITLADISGSPLTITVTAATKIKAPKDGQAPTLADIKVGETVGGSYLKNDGGKLVAATLHVGEKQKKKKATTE